MKKIISVLLVFIILVCSLSLPASAATTKRRFMRGKTKTLHAASSTDYKDDAEKILAQYGVDIDSLLGVVGGGISNCRYEVDITDYNLPATEEVFYAICDLLFYAIPEIFNIGSVDCDYYESTGNIGSLYFEYYEFADTAKEYSECLSKLQDSAQILLNGIQGNDNLDDEQKLLLLHDRLAMWNEYGYSKTATEDESHTAYGALVNRIAVCQGYAMAYMYLLDHIGIKNYYCSSEKLNHAWNIVYVDGKSYHVDVTWDDIGWSDDVDGVPGTVWHDNFLRSSRGIYDVGHTANDYDTTPISTKYDNYFWQNSDTEFQLVNGEIYYVDNRNATLKRYSDDKTLCSVEADWQADDEYVWDGNFTCLSSDGVALYYSQPNAIYRYDLATNKLEAIHTFTLENYFSVYGFTYENDKLICDINNEPPGGEFSNKYSVSIPYVYVVSNKYGDVNDDGKINGKDYTLLMQYINNWDVTIEKDNADLNVDGKINAKDYTLLVRYLNDWDVVLG